MGLSSVTLDKTEKMPAVKATKGLGKKKEKLGVGERWAESLGLGLEELWGLEVNRSGVKVPPTSCPGS